jgi:rubrerythrin
MFLREGRWRRAFEQAAARTEDPCLHQLFAQLAQRSGDHMDAIRRVLEGL